MNPNEDKQLIAAIQQLAKANEALAGELHDERRGHLQLVSLRTFAEMLDCSESAISKGVKTGAFPPPAFHLFPGEKGGRWTKNQVELFIQTKSTQAPPIDEDLPAESFKGIIFPITRAKRHA